MTISTFAAPSRAGSATTGAGYRPGVCNIGPAEIRRRRLAGHLGLAASVVLLTILLIVDAPAWSRLLLVAPATVSASGYLQARLRFCAGFAQLGIYNFGDRGGSTPVVDEAARVADRRRAREISLSSLAIGVAVGLVAALLPV